MYYVKGTNSKSAPKRYLTTKKCPKKIALHTNLSADPYRKKEKVFIFFRQIIILSNIKTHTKSK